MKFVGFTVLWCCWPAHLHAGSRTSASYAVVADVVDNGGQRTSSATYVNIGSAGGVSGVATEPQSGVAINSGYPAQIAEVKGLVLTSAGATLNEGGALQLSARQELDDATFLAVPSASVAWSISAGSFATISSSGLVSAGAVYQDTPVTVRGIFANHTGTLHLTITNTNSDNFRIFALDGIDDALQLRASVLAAPSADSDGDGASDVLEYAFGTDLSSASNGLVEFGGAAVFHRGLPTLWVQNVANGVDFRAVFGRRKDYVAAGLTFTVQFSADLATWQNSNAVPTVIASDTVIDAVSVPYPFFVNGRKTRFFRVVVSTP